MSDAYETYRPIFSGIVRLRRIIHFQSYTFLQAIRALQSTYQNRKCPLSELFLPAKANGGAVYAVAKTSWGGAVIEYMAQVAATLAAHYFHAYHTVAVVPALFNYAFGYFGIKAGPAAVPVEFAVGAE